MCGIEELVWKGSIKLRALKMKQSQLRKGKAVQAKAIALQSIESGKSLVWWKLWKECSVSRARG